MSSEDPARSAKRKGEDLDFEDVSKRFKFTSPVNLLFMVVLRGRWRLRGRYMPLFRVLLFSH